MLMLLRLLVLARTGGKAIDAINEDYSCVSATAQTNLTISDLLFTVQVLFSLFQPLE
jgi:hypothetical protein